MNIKQPSDRTSHNLFSRRQLLKLIAVAPLYWQQAYAGALDFQSSPSNNRRLLAVTLDILIPRDITPSATDLKLDVAIMSLADQVSRYPELLEQGLGWLESTSIRSFNKAFLELQLKHQNLIVDAAFNQPDMTLPKVFIERLRDDVMTLYYHHNAAWKGMAIEQPIQPTGYPKHDKSPEEL